MRHRLTLIVFFLTIAAPATAQADWLLTPFAGINFGGSTAGEKVNYGASLAFMGAGILGFEVDFGFAPNFFEPDPDPFDLVGDSNVTTLMVNLVGGIPIGGQTGGGVRPYVSGGVGLLKTNVDSPDGFFSVHNNDFGVNVGAGVTGFFNDHIGVRGDLRYFRNLTDPEEDNEFDIDFGGFNFWRGTAGVVFRF